MNGIKFFLLDTNVVISLLKESEAAIALAEANSKISQPF
jgi:predicted nucleic acid-binding protein